MCVCRLLVRHCMFSLLVGGGGFCQLQFFGLFLDIRWENSWQADIRTHGYRFGSSWVLIFWHSNVQLCPGHRVACCCVFVIALLGSLSPMIWKKIMLCACHYSICFHIISSCIHLSSHCVRGPCCRFQFEQHAPSCSTLHETIEQCFT